MIGITNNRDTTRSQSFTYDYLNRLTSAQNSGTNCNPTTVNGKTEYWGNGYVYDPWGNLLQKNVTKCSAENLSVTALSNNQLSGYSYDAAGNMTSDPTAPAKSYIYDAENRINSATMNGVTTSYTYDADGNRVEKSSSGTGTIFWYMSPGIVAESDLSGNLKSEYVFFGSDRVARKDFSGSTTSVAYYFSDHLKTASVITNSAGVIAEDEDYYPWGGELQFVNSDSNHYKFTGKERDAETGLDYFGARYYGNWLGRWASPDPLVSSAHAANPQSWNRYIYVYDNPLRHVDPDGRQALDVSNPAVQKLIKTLKAVPGKTARSFKGGVVQTLLEPAERNLLGGIFGYNPMAIQGGLNPAEFKQLNKASAYEKGALMSGVGDKKQPGIDAVDLTNGKGVSLKGAQNIERAKDAAVDALKSADNAGFHDVNVYIDAPNVLKADASGLSKIQNVLGTGTITKVVIFTKDGAVEYTPTAEQQKQIECKRSGKSSCP